MTFVSRVKTNSPGVPLSIPSNVLTGLVLQPPELKWNGAGYSGSRAGDVDKQSAENLPGVVQLVIRRNFVGIVALNLPYARDAAARIQIEWIAPLSRQTPQDPSSAQTERDEPSLVRNYRWPMHTGGASPSSAVAVAWWQEDGVTIWTSSSAPERLRTEVALLLGLPVGAVNILPNGLAQSADSFDAAADAALLSQSVGKPVRVDASASRRNRDADLRLELQVKASLHPGGNIKTYALRSNHACWNRPSIARLLVSSRPDQLRQVNEINAPYTFVQKWTNTRESFELSSLPASENVRGAAYVFAHESLMDEAAHDANRDPIAYRLQQMEDPRGAALIGTVAQRAQWTERKSGAVVKVTTDHGTMVSVRHGRGFGYASVVDDGMTPPQRSWSAWVADVEVDAEGRIDITRVVVGHDVEQLNAAAGGPEWIKEQVHNATEGLLLEPPAFDDWSASSAQPPKPARRNPLPVDLVAPRQDLTLPSGLAWSSAANLPAAAAIANALFDATGVRLREPPFHGRAVQQALALKVRPRVRNNKLAAICGSLVATVGLAASVWPWYANTIPSAVPDLSVYSPAAVERGRLVAAAGDCMACHTVPHGAPYAGGLPLATPFGTVYSTNITPDQQTGIGHWSYTAFERAMRQGIHRDGRQLYPAFPYTAFAKMTEGDMQGVYAYLMSQPPVRFTPPSTKLAFPFGVRSLMAGWNALFHDDKVYQPDPSKLAEWNRGAYLVQGMGHCGGCHTPRNSLGAEKNGTLHFLAGGTAEGWDAPSLNELASASNPWDKEDLLAYLRTGFSPRHGVAAGPMAPVVQGLAQLPESDVRAIATYLMALSPGTAMTRTMNVQAPAPKLSAGRELGSRAESGQRIFNGACAVCHDTQSGPTLFGARPSLTFSTKLHSDRPDNLLQVILNGIADPAGKDLGYMPGFGDSLSDAQIEELTHYMRLRFGDGKAPWENVGKTIARIRHERAA